MSRTALIIVDMQQFTAAIPLHDADGLLRRLNELADATRRNGGLVIFIQHDGPEGSPFHPSMPDWKIRRELHVDSADVVVRKTSCDAFLNTTLDNELRAFGAESLVITGWATDYCVDTTVRSALARSYRTIVPLDGHTAADRPHLPAEKIIAHHNAIWADFLAPAGPARVCRCSEVSFS